MVRVVEGGGGKSKRLKMDPARMDAKNKLMNWK
jgi:hypothetical protein